MRKLKKIDNKAKNIDALTKLFLGGHLSDEVYLIRKNLEGETPDVTLWMSSFDYRALLILANGSRVSVLEVEANTVRTRRGGKAPEGTEMVMGAPWGIAGSWPMIAF